MFLFFKIKLLSNDIFRYFDLLTEISTLLSAKIDRRSHAALISR